MFPFTERLRTMLKWSERHTSVDITYLAHGGSWLSLGSFAGILTSFALGLVAANYVNPEIYGVYKYVLSFVAILTMATLPGMDQAYIQAVSRGREGDLFSVLRKKIIWGLLGSLGSLLCAAYYFANDNLVLASSFAIVAVFIPFMDSFSLYDDLLQGRRAFPLSTKLSILSQVSSSLLLILTILYAPQAIALVLMYCASLTFIRAALLLYTLKKQPPNNERDNETSSYGMNLTFMRASSVIAGSLGGIVIFQVLGGTALALYAFAVAPTELVRGWMNLMSTLLLPKFSQDSWSIMSFREFMYKTRFFFLALTFAVAVYIMIAPLLFETLLPQYIDAVQYSRLYIGTLLFTGAIIIFNVMLRAKRRVRELHIANIVSIAGSVALSVPFAYFFGIGGLIAAIYMGKVIDTLTQGYFTFRSKKSTEATV